MNAGYNQHEAELAKQRKVDTLKQQHGDLDKKEPKDLQRTKNVTGPPVYYPPGHEMFAKKEEAGAWRAEVRFTNKIPLIVSLYLKLNLFYREQWLENLANINTRPKVRAKVKVVLVRPSCPFVFPCVADYRVQFCK